MAAYGIAIFTGAFLLFQVQPLMGKYLLPWFGGAPGVWTTCMLFFQVLLLAGYGYAHASARFLRLRAQVLLHLVLIGAALLSLPITPDPGWSSAWEGDPTFRILGLLAASLGLPYLVVSGTAPLLQHWFSRSRPGVSPFRLYALSNAGSLLALLSYPSLVETSMTRAQQAFGWGAGLVVYGLACAWAGYQVWRSPVPLQAEAEQGANEQPAMGGQKLFWVLLPACASVLLLAVTNKICQDVAVIPFLWILPLTLYLLSFILCFEKPSWYVRGIFAPALVLLLAATAWAMQGRSSLTPPVQIFIYSLTLFVCCVICHGELYRLRPAPRYLTGFYLLLSLGGALGGVFTGLVAPRIFTDYYELHLGLGGCALLLLAVCWREQQGGSPRWPRPVWAAAATAVLVHLGTLYVLATQNWSTLLVRSRNFYGVLSVFEQPRNAAGMRVRELVHGRVAHGLEAAREGELPVPTMYYTEASGVGRALKMLTGDNRRLGVVGLGAGTLAAYGRAGDRLRFYEINPEVERIAREQFNFLQRSAATVEVVLGDARLTLEREAPQEYDLLALDAFSSDAVPLHLLTREAFRLYSRHLKSDGILAVHVSNLSLNLEPPVVRAGREIGLHPVVIENRQRADDYWVQTSTWVLLFRRSEMTNDPAIRLASRPVWPTGFTVPEWTDDFAALFPVVRWTETLRLTTPAAETLVQRAAKLMEEGRLAAAIDEYGKAMRLPAPSPGVMNNLAWLLATTPDAQLRNGAEAVRLAQMACGLTEHQETVFIGTLAAAYAEAGDFAQAVAAAERACALARERNEMQLLARNTELLELYQRRLTVAQSEAARRGGR